MGWVARFRVRVALVVRVGEARWVGFVVLRVSNKYVSLIGRAFVSPPSTVLIAGEEPIAQANWRAEMKIKEYHVMHEKDMLG